MRKSKDNQEPKLMTISDFNRGGSEQMINENTKLATRRLTFVHDGKEYRLHVNEWNELTLTANDGKLAINPTACNQIRFDSWD